MGKKLLKSSIIEMFFSLIIAIVEFFKIKIFIQYAGSEINGYYQFINQIVAYLFLAEAGLSSGIIFKLYKPFSDNNEEKINSICFGGKKIYKKIVLIMSAIILGMALIFPFIVHASTKEILIIEISFLLIAFSNVLGFAFYSKIYFCLYSANQKRYISSMVTDIIKVIFGLLTIICVIKFKSLLVIAICIFISKIIEEITIYFVGKKHFKYLHKTNDLDTSASKMTNDLIFHQIGSLAANNIDSIILMIFGGPLMVSIYSSYNYITQFLTTMFGKITANVIHAFGNIFINKDNEESFTLFKEYFLFCFLSSLFISLCFYTGISSFITLWIGKNDYVLGNKVIFMFTSILFINMSYSPMITAITANGYFKDSKYYTLISSIVNFILSLIFVNFWGITGVLFATLLSTFVSISFRSYLISKKVFPNLNKFYFLHLYMINYFIFIIFTIIATKFFRNVFLNPQTYITWFLNMFWIAITIAISIILIFYYTNDDTKKLIKRALRLIRGGH